MTVEVTLPRPRNPDKEAHRAAQERYRRRLKDARKPEAQPVDWAIAAAFSVALARLREGGRSSSVLEAVVADSKSILLGDGYSANEAVRKLMARLLFRDDLPTLKGVTAKPADDGRSPHYFALQKRDSRNSRSEERCTA